MSLLKKNITANFIGNIWQALMGLAFIPLYIKFMGPESYGLVGVFAVLQATFSLLDIGLGSTVTREMARLSVLPGSAQEMRSMVRTLEIIYWGIALLIGITVMALSPLLAHRWVIVGQLSPKAVEQAIVIMGFVIALQMPTGFYCGGLMGLQKQVLVNVTNIGTSTLRGVGAIGALLLISPTIQTFFLWQVVVSAISTFLSALLLRRNLCFGKNRASFQKRLLSGVWRFSAGIGGITILAVLLTQLDKIILSKMLPLEMFGYYTLANMVGMSLNRITGPVFAGIYPRFTQLVSVNDQEGLRNLYNKSCQFMAVLILPITVVIAVFSYDVLLIWTQSVTIAGKCHVMVSILICGTALNGFMHLPYALQLAFGWTRIGLKIVLFLIAIFVPTIIVLTKYYGPTGAASAWVALNAIYMIIGVPLTHRRILKGEAVTWFNNILYPLAGVLTVTLAGNYLIKTFFSALPIVIPIISIFLVAVCIAVLLSKEIRGFVSLHLAGGK